MIEARRQPWTAGDASALTLRVAQFPFDTRNRWLALNEDERGAEYDTTRDRGRLSIVAAFGAPQGVPVLTTGTGGQSDKLAGLLLDQWDEMIPSATASTGVSFQYDGPSSQAPQCLLLAVPAQRGTAAKSWDVADLAAIVYDTLDLAKVRAVDLDAMRATSGTETETSGIGWALPGLLLPRDPGQPGYERETLFQTIEDWLKVIAPS
jgi:hypothetical protein